MIIINKESAVFKRKDRTREYEDVQIVDVDELREPNAAWMRRNPKKEKNFLVKTRIRKDNDSKYVNSPSREIKKWFELRRI